MEADGLAGGKRKALNISSSDSASPLVQVTSERRSDILRKARKAKKKAKTTRETTEDQSAQDYADYADMEGALERQFQAFEARLEGRIEQIINSALEVKLESLEEKLRQDFERKVSAIREEQEELRGEIFDLKNREEALKKEVKIARGQAIEATEEATKAAQKTTELAEQVNKLEQYGRQNNVRVFGVEEEEGSSASEQTEHKVVQIFRRMGLSFSPSDIEAAHRLGGKGRRREGDARRPRTIIVRFVNRRAAEDVLAKRRGLKGTKISVAEDLTTKNYVLLRRAVHAPGVSEAWSKRGTVFIKTTVGGGVRRIDSERDLLSLPIPSPTSASTPTNSTSPRNHRYTTSTPTNSTCSRNHRHNTPRSRLPSF